MNRCEILSRQYPNTVILQLSGGFYNAFDNSAMVLASIMDYKLTRTGTGKYKTGFPINTLDKVLLRFNDCHINTMVFDNDKNIESLQFDDNKFIEYIDSTLLISEETEEKAIDKLDNNKIIVSELEFIDYICNGIDPYTKSVTNNIDINDARTIRMFYRIRDILRCYQKEGD